MSGIFLVDGDNPWRAAWLLRHQPSRARGRLYQWSEAIFFDRVNDTYARWLSHGAPISAADPSSSLLRDRLPRRRASTRWYPRVFFPAVRYRASSTALSRKHHPTFRFDAMSSRMQRIGDIVMADPDPSQMWATGSGRIRQSARGG